MSGGETAGCQRSNALQQFFFRPFTFGAVNDNRQAADDAVAMVA
jgi:hypothetical protein